MVPDGESKHYTDSMLLRDALNTNFLQATLVLRVDNTWNILLVEWTTEEHAVPLSLITIQHFQPYPTAFDAVGISKCAYYIPEA